MALLIDMIWVLIHVFSDVAAFVGFNTGCRVPLAFGLGVVLLSLSDSGDSLIPLLVSSSMFPVSYLGHSSRKTHSFYRTGMSPYLYNHNKPKIHRGILLTMFLGKVLPFTLFQTQIGHFIHFFFRHSSRPPKKICTCLFFTSLLSRIHVSVITVFRKVDSLKGTQTNF